MREVFGRQRWVVGPAGCRMGWGGVSSGATARDPFVRRLEAPRVAHHQPGHVLGNSESITAGMTNCLQ